MSDSTSLLEQIDGSQAEHEVTANNLFDAASAGAAYGRHAEACAGLTWGYYGTRYGGSAVANGTNACGASTTTYMVVNLSTGAVSFATSTTNWNDSAIYGRAYKIVTGTATVTSYEDHRFGPLGIFGAAGSASQLSALTDVAIATSPGPSDGDSLIYDAMIGKWVASPVFGGGGGSPGTGLQLNVYSSGSGSWSKPTGAQLVRVICIGGGGGGGGGVRRSSGGTYPAGGGGGAARIEAWFKAVDLGSTESYSVGAGGGGGAGGTTADAQGGAGSAGGESNFGTTVMVRAYGGGGAAGGSSGAVGAGGGAGFLSAGGSTSTGTAGAAGTFGGAIGGASGAGADNQNPFGGAGGSSGAANGAGLSGGMALHGGCGGSGGGGITSSPGVTNPGTGAVIWPGMTAAAAGTSGASPTAGGNGPAPLSLMLCGGGGAGGGSSITSGVDGANGGDGGIGSGGGGGGNCYTASTTKAGDGGDGGSGKVIVVTYF